MVTRARKTKPTKGAIMEETSRRKAAKVTERRPEKREINPWRATKRGEKRSLKMTRDDQELARRLRRTARYVEFLR